MTARTSLFLLACLFACDESPKAAPDNVATLIGSWRFLSEVRSSCTDPSGNRTEQCAGSASDCGILTFTETGWTLVKTGPHGQPSTQTGSYNLTGSMISFSGGGPGYSSPAFALSGASIT